MTSENEPKSAQESTAADIPVEEVSQNNVDNLEEVSLENDEVTSPSKIDSESSNNTSSSVHHAPIEPELLKQDKIEQILRLKVQIDQLITNVRHTKSICNRYENENQYLQDYVGSLMKSGTLN